jgi:hypothetical protein
VALCVYYGRGKTKIKLSVHGFRSRRAHHDRLTPWQISVDRILGVHALTRSSRISVLASSVIVVAPKISVSWAGLVTLTIGAVMPGWASS